VRTSLALLVAACLPLAAAGAPLGKLFHSAQERELRAKQRRGELVTATGQPAVVARKPVVTGYVTRSDGKSTVFLDKRPYATSNERLQRQLNHRMIERYVEPEPVPVALPAPAPTPTQAPSSTPANLAPAPANLAPAAPLASPARTPGES
jgi:hypothetical protein